MRKKRILWVSEGSFLNTGFSVQTHEILSRLYKSDKYEIAELGSYVRPNDPNIIQIPWEFYSAIPQDHDKVGQQRYQSSNLGQFGEAVFEQVCLDFKPDIVITIRDPWMDEFVGRSPYREMFKWIWMPTIDGEPQRLPWIDDYSKADLILTLSRYGKETLEKDSKGRIKVMDVARPGVNHEIFKPLDKKDLRQKFKIPDNAKVIMTVMRNQKRKLYPDLLEMFKDYLCHCAEKGNEDLAKNTYLYLHTSYPDVGYDISKLILDNNIGHRVLVTYKCEACKAFYPDFFQTEASICRYCGEPALHMPNTQHGLTREELNIIYNLSDAYVQYAICEGLGMPICEAKSCEIPSFAVDYTAMAEQVEQGTGCFPIKVQRFFHESVIETEQKRALPDNEDAIKKLYRFFTLPVEVRQKLGELARKDASENYSFDRAASIFGKAIDSIEIKPAKEAWENLTPRYKDIPKEVPKFRTNSDFIDWCIDNILGQPDLKQTHWRNEMLKGLNVGYIPNKNAPAQSEEYNIEIALNSFINTAKIHNFWEKIRINQMQPVDKEKVVNFEMI